jgi:hypothetical protein
LEGEKTEAQYWFSNQKFANEGCEEQLREAHGGAYSWRLRILKTLVSAETPCSKRDKEQLDNSSTIMPFVRPQPAGYSTKVAED